MAEGLVHIDADTGEVLEESQLAPATLFGTSDGSEIAEQAAAKAKVLKQIVTQNGLAKRLGKGSKEYISLEGWTFLGSMFGVFGVVKWTRELENGWEARVEAVTLAGQVVGAAEAMCTRAESNWKNRDDYALRSMAQTRATSKALRLPLSFVVVLAGYEATPSDEMPSTGPDWGPPGRPAGEGVAPTTGKPQEQGHTSPAGASESGSNLSGPGSGTSEAEGRAVAAKQSTRNADASGEGHADPKPPTTSHRTPAPSADPRWKELWANLYSYAEASETGTVSLVNRANKSSWTVGNKDFIPIEDLEKTVAHFNLVEETRA